MFKKILYNIVIFLIIIIIILKISPDTDSLLYILQKHLNYFIYHIKNFILKYFFNKKDTFINTYISPYEVSYVKYFKNKYPNIEETDIYNIFSVLYSLIKKNTDITFLTPSNPIPLTFTVDEQNKIKNILLTKLNNSSYIFVNLNFTTPLIYYNNFSGKEVEPFIFTIDTNIGSMRIYIDIDIRNDIIPDTEYLIINNIQLLKDKQVIFSDNKNIIMHNNI